MIAEFQGEYRFLSNFWPCNVFGYKSSEHAYQACKFPKGSKEREAIRACQSPGQTKRMAKAFSEAGLRRTDFDFDSKKLEIMEALVREKFTKNPDLKEKLLATGDEKLVEGNRWHDNYWGKCYCVSCSNRHGWNHLGEILMKVRKELQDIK